MKYYSFQIVIEKEADDEGYYAYCPNLPGCFSNGISIEETKKNIREAIALHVESAVAHKQPFETADRLVHVEVLTMAFPE